MNSLRPCIDTVTLGGSVFRVYRFINGWGALVRKHTTSFGWDKGFVWELVGVQWETYTSWKISFSCPPVGGPKQNLSIDSVNNLLSQIELLPRIDPHPRDLDPTDYLVRTYG